VRDLFLAAADVGFRPAAGGFHAGHDQLFGQLDSQVVQAPQQALVAFDQVRVNAHGASLNTSRQMRK
jgi:hypothetical protein